MIYLITGGSGSGKSTYAESLMMRFSPPFYYVATMLPYGEEAHRRIERHRRIRAGKGFETIEKGTAISEISLPDPSGSALLECVGTLMANEMFEETGAGENAEESVLSGITRLSKAVKNLVIVTNEVGSDGYPYLEGTMKYMEALGRTNIRIAQIADAIIEVSAGQPMILKGAVP